MYPSQSQNVPQFGNPCSIAFHKKQASNFGSRIRAYVKKNPDFVHIRFVGGRQSTVSVFDVVPCSSAATPSPESITYHHITAEDKQPTTPSDSSPLHSSQRRESIPSTSVDNSHIAFTNSSDPSTRSNSSFSELPLF